MKNAARNYVAALRIMKEEGCQGVTMDCRSLVTDRKMSSVRLLDALRLEISGFEI